MKQMKTCTPKKEKGRYAAPALESALKIIDLMSRDAAEHGINEISRKLGISVNMAYRVLIQLAHYGYAELTAAGKYRLSTRLFTIGMRLYARFDLRARSRPHLEALCEITNETCQIQIPDKDRIAVLDCVTPRTDFYLKTVPGSRLYYHANAFGKAVLAFMDETDLRAALPEPLPNLTVNTKTTRKQLMKELADIKKTGLAYDREEYLTGLYCIGAPVFDINEKVVAGLGITGILSCLSADRWRRHKAQVLNCAAKVSRDIGYEGVFFDNLSKPENSRKKQENKTEHCPQNTRQIKTRKSN